MQALTGPYSMIAMGASDDDSAFQLNIENDYSFVSFVFAMKHSGKIGRAMGLIRFGNGDLAKVIAIDQIWIEDSVSYSLFK
jgi:hypothetical protein